MTCSFTTLLTFLLSQFSGIVAVSNGPSWRVDGLLEAANLTGIDIDIPQQPAWTAEDIDTFRRFKDPGAARKIGPGQTQCWMGHRHALSHALSRGWDTVLVLEDDVDWDINIKHQLAVVAPHVLAVTQFSSKATASQPYGHSWDMLWIGHCGDAIPPTGTRLFKDETLPASQKYREYTGEYTMLTAEPQQRIVHKSNGPICTFAYAVTASAATKILQYTDRGVSNIVSTDLRWWCQAGFLACVTVNPELFHHHKKSGEVNSEIAVREGWQDLAAPAMEDFTANIRYSARCNARAVALVSCQDVFDGNRAEAAS